MKVVYWIAALMWVVGAVLGLAADGEFAESLVGAIPVPLVILLLGWLVTTLLKRVGRKKQI
jgi:hypothetical protein